MSAIIILIIIAEFQNSIIWKPPLGYNSVCIVGGIFVKQRKPFPQEVCIRFEKIKMLITYSYIIFPDLFYQEREIHC